MARSLLQIWSGTLGETYTARQFSAEPTPAIVLLGVELFSKLIRLEGRRPYTRSTTAMEEIHIQRCCWIQQAASYTARRRLAAISTAMPGTETVQVAGLCLRLITEAALRDPWPRSDTLPSRLSGHRECAVDRCACGGVEHDLNRAA